MRKILLTLLLTLTLLSCQQKQNSNPPSITSSGIPLNLQTGFPSDLDVPINPQSKYLNGTTAFVVQDNPILIIPINLTTSPLTIHPNFATTNMEFLKANNSNGIYPGEIYIHNDTWGFFAYTGVEINTGKHLTGVVAFNPTNGNIRFHLNCSVQVDNSNTQYKDTKGNTPPNFPTTYASGITVLGNTLLVSTSNRDPNSSFADPVYFPGTVLVYHNIFQANNTKTPDQILFSSPDPRGSQTRYFNPTQVTRYKNTVLLVNSGLQKYNPQFQNQAYTPSSVDFIEIQQNQATITASADFGLAALGQEEVSFLTLQQTDYALLGSTVRGEFFRLNLHTRKAVETAQNPIILNQTPNEWLTVTASGDNSLIFACSAAEAKIYILRAKDLLQSNTPQKPTPLKIIDVQTPNANFTFPSNLVSLPPKITDKKYILHALPGLPASLIPTYKIHLQALFTKANPTTVQSIQEILTFP